MKTIHFISPYFLPSQNTESFLSAKILKAIAKCNVKKIFIYDIQDSGEMNNEWKQYYKTSSIEIETIKIFNSNKIFKKIEAKSISLSLVVKYIYILLARKRFNLCEDDILFTRSQPHIAHLCRWFMFKGKASKWIAHFSDPLSENKYNSNLKNITIFNALEKLIFYNASSLVFTASSTLSVYKDKYKKLSSKMQWIPHCYDSSIHNVKKYNALISSIMNNQKINIIYFGSFYGLRNPEKIFSALAKIENMNNGILNKFNIIFFSNLINGFSYYEKYYTCVTFFPYVSYIESLQIMEKVDLLLLIDANIKESIFLPSKLVDYLGSKKPIIAITPENSETRYILSGNNQHYLFNYEEEDKLINFFIDCDRDKLIKEERDDVSHQEFSIENITEKFKRVICE